MTISRFFPAASASVVLVALLSHSVAASSSTHDDVGATRKKVFGLGLSKTGTTSMAEAMRHLGYDALHTDRSLAPFMHHGDDVPSMERYYDDVDSVWDIPTAAYYRQLLAAYPDAKFVLTTRDSKTWYESFVAYLEEYMYYSWGCVYPERVQRLHEYVYGSRLPNETTWIDAFERHNNDVISFFAEKAPEQLLVVDIDQHDDKWGLMCSFLEYTEGPCATLDDRVGAAVMPFPHTNIAAYHTADKKCTSPIESPNGGSTFAYVMLLCGNVDTDKMADYVRMLVVLGEGIRRLDTKNDIVVMVHGEISEQQLALFEKLGYKVLHVADVGSQPTDAETLRVSDDLSSCYRAKINTLQLTQYERVVYLDGDIVIKRDLQFLFKGNGFFGYEGTESPLNTGLFSVTPSSQAFNDLKDIATSNAFHPADGWLGYGPFPHWRFEGHMSDWSFWCAHTDQGIMYYYFDKVAMDSTILPKEESEDLFSHLTGDRKWALSDRIVSDDNKWNELMADNSIQPRPSAGDSARVTAAASRRHHRALQMDPYADPYAVPTPQPTPCDKEQEVYLELWNADTDMPIGLLGDEIDLCLYGGIGLSIVAAPPCKDLVTFTLFDEHGNRAAKKNRESVPPLSLGGDFGDDLLAVPALQIPGAYTLKVNPRPGATKEFTFAVVDCF